MKTQLMRENSKAKNYMRAFICMNWIIKIEN